MGFLVAQMVKNLPAMQETGVQSLGWEDLQGEDPLEKELATHSITLAWSIPWTEQPGGLQFMGSQSGSLALSAAALDLRRGVTPLGRHPLGMGSSRLLPLTWDVR